MGALVLGVAGAAVGSLFGPLGASIGFAIGSGVGNYFFQPTIEGPKLNDLKLQSASYGQPIPVIYPSMRVAGNVIWQTDLVPHTKTSGGKGGPKVKTTTYTASFAILLGESVDGPSKIKGIRKIWVNGALKYDRSNSDDFAFTFYDGNEFQVPDPTMEDELGTGNVPAYRGRAMVVFKDFNLETYGNTIPLFHFEIYPDQQEGLITQVGTLDQDPPWDNSLVIGDWETDWETDPTMTGPGVAQQAELHYLEYAGGTRSAYYLPVGGHVLDDGSIIQLELLQGREVFDTSELPALTDPSVHVSGSGPSSTVQGTSWGATFGLPSTHIQGAMLSQNGRILMVFMTADELANETVHWYKIINGEVVADGTCSLVTGQVFGYTVTLSLPIPVGSSSVSPGPFAVGMMENDGIHGWIYVGNAQVITGTPFGSLFVFKIKDGDDFSWNAENGAGTPIRTGGVRGSLTITQPGYCGTIGGDLTALWTRLDPDTEQITLGDIVGDQSRRAGLSDEEIDVSELTEVVDGYLIAQPMTPRAAIEPLQNTFFFDAVEEDGVVMFRHLGQEPVVTIPDADLAARPDGQDGPALAEIARTPEEELPATISFVFINPEIDYQLGTQIAKRMACNSELARTVNAPIAMTDQRATQAAWAMLFNAWYERPKLQLVVSRKYAKYGPTDVVSARGYQLRIVSKTETPDGVITWTCVPSRSLTLIQGGLSGTPSAGGGEVTKSQATTLALLDIPYITDDAHQWVYHAGMAGAVRRSWVGASLQESTDGGTTYDEVTSSSIPDTMGSATTVLAEFLGGNMVDEINIVRVELDVGAGELASVTLEQMWNGANEFLLGAEILQARDCTLVATRTYDLTGLLRGRRGTEWAMNTHRIGELFVALPVGSEIDSKSYDHGVTRKFKAVTFGRTVESATAVSFRNCGVSLLPYSPVHLGCGEDGSSGYVLTWTRRARINAQWQPFIDVPLDEATEAYEVYLWNSTYQTKLATLTCSTPTLTVTAAQLTSAYGSPQVPYWSVAQVGRLGPGYDSLGRAPVVVETNEQPPEPPSEPTNPSETYDGGWHDDFRFENGGGALTNAMKNANWLMEEHGSSWSFCYVYASRAGLTAALQGEFIAQYGSSDEANKILNTMAGYSGYAPAGWLRPWGGQIIGTGANPWVQSPNSPPALRAYAGNVNDGPTIIPLPYQDNTST